MRKITCLELLHYLSDFMDDDLDEKTALAVEHHLATCHNCRIILDSTLQTQLIFRSLANRKIPDEQRQKMFDNLKHSFLKAGE